MEAPLDEPSSPATKVELLALKIRQRYQVLLDWSTPQHTARWAIFALLVVLFFARVFIAAGWYIIAYAFAIYVLNLFIAFLSPRFEPQADEDGDDGLALPTKADEEFKPFVRRLPEFKFWLSAMKGIASALFCSMFRMFDVPVFWPILVMYFLILFTITMKRQIKHMVKHKYLPWNVGKKKYGGMGSTTKNNK
eukprot:CFRG7652T1